MTDDETKEAGRNILVALGVPVFVSLFTAVALIVSIPFQLFYVWSLQKLYIWFLIPLKAPHVNLWEIWGLLLIYRTISYSVPTNKKTNLKKIATDIFGQIFFYGTVLLLGYFIKGHITL